jgi:hypothetical protein
MRKEFLKFAIVLTTAALLGGCSLGGLLSGKRGIPSDEGAAVSSRNELAMPPDLTLAAPGTAQAATPSLDDGGIENLDAPVAAPVTRKVAAANPQGDIYEQYGISKLNADGSKKEEWKLREELRQAIIARKKKANPGYGTVRNIGGLFSDN